VLHPHKLAELAKRESGSAAFAGRARLIPASGANRRETSADPAFFRSSRTRGSGAGPARGSRKRAPLHHRRERRVLENGGSWRAEKTAAMEPASADRFAFTFLRQKAVAASAKAGPALGASSLALASREPERKSASSKPAMSATVRILLALMVLAAPTTMMPQLSDRFAIAARLRAILAKDLDDRAATAHALGVDETSLRLSIDAESPHPTLDVLVGVIVKYGVDPSYLINGVYDRGTHLRHIDDDIERATDAVRRLMLRQQVDKIDQPGESRAP
jgi:hypothetical protein